MANVIRFSSSNYSGSIKIGNAVIGISDTVNYAPTSETGFYTALIPNSGYTIYASKSLGPAIYVPSNDSELISLTNYIAGTNFTTTSSAFDWYTTQSNIIVTNKAYPDIVTDGLVVLIDASFLASYPRQGTTAYDISGNTSNGSLLNGMGFDGGTNTFASDYSDDVILIDSGIIKSSNPTEFTAEVVIKTNTTTLSVDEDIWVQPDHSPNQPFAWWYDAGFDKYAWLFTDTNGTYTGVTYSNTTYIAQRYTHLAVTFKAGGQSKLYINGNQDSNVMDVSSLINKAGLNNNVRLMNDEPLDGPINGDMGYARAYFKELSAAEIKQNYYQAPIVTDGLIFATDAGNLVSYESGSTITYSLTGSFTGSLQNGVGYSVKNGGAWVFDGVDDRIYYGSQPINFNPSTQPFSMGGWINLLSQGGSGDRAVLLDICGSASSRLYIAIDKNNLRLVVDLRPPAGTISVPVFGNVNSISLGEWVYGIVTFDGGTIKLYQNGELINTATSFTNYPNSLDNWYSGHQDDNNHYMDGYISSVFLYLKTLTAEEVSQNFNAQRSRFGM